MYTPDDHTFVICAYKENPYLEECIKSILNQEALGKVIVTTYTPNNYIKGLCEKYSLPLHIGDGNRNTAKDSYNFASSIIETPLYTLCHQDDIYLEKYLVHALKALNRAKEPLLYFSNYFELREKSIIKSNTILRVKRILLFPLRFRIFQNSKLIRRRILGLGDPICHPTWCHVKEKMPTPLFKDSDVPMVLDYDFLEILSAQKGGFVYGKSPDLYHRIHKDTGTTEAIENGTRTAEELVVLRRLWPKPIANIISKIYAKSQSSNGL